MTDIVLTTTGAGTSTHVAVEAKRRRVTPDLLETLVVQVPCLKFGCLEEGAGIDLTFRANTASGSRGTTYIKTRQFVAKGIEVEK